MKSIGIAALVLTVAAMGMGGCSHRPHARTSVPIAQNLADDFLEFWDATRGLSTSERVERFQRDIAPRFPEFYDIARFNGAMSPERRNKQLAAAIDGFGPMREAYAAKVRGFESTLSRNLVTFTAAFPDFKGDTPIYLLHSLGEMDGGLREIGGRRYLVFGADGMVRYHSWIDESAFFHHELFHVYHAERLGECQALWCTLWQEGLAVLLAKRLNPGAGPAELLLDVPAGLVDRTKKQLPAAFSQLKRSLLSTDSRQEALMFQGGTTAEGDGLPRRYGYYLGYLVAEELARQHDLFDLARLPAGEAQALVREAVSRLAARAGSMD